MGGSGPARTALDMLIDSGNVPRDVWEAFDDVGARCVRPSNVDKVDKR